MDAMVDVAVVGAGPAGATTARLLAARGFDVALLHDDAPRRLRSTEVMSPACLRAVEPWLPDTLLDSADIAVPCAGIQARWAGHAADYQHYDDRALLVDRTAFDKALIAACHEEGVELISACRIQRIGAAPHHLRLEGEHMGAPWSIKARFVVDATGRTRRIARLLGAKRHALTRQVAVRGYTSGSAVDGFDPWFRVERSRFGWWSAVKLPKGGYELMFYRALPSLAPDADAIARLFRSTRLSREVGEWGRAADGAGRGADAGFSALESVGGHRWLAVGDAALAFDPISSQGLWHAVGSANAAAAAINDYLAREDAQGLAGYGFRTLATLRHHARQLHNHYGGWP